MKKKIITRIAISSLILILLISAIFLIHFCYFKKKAEISPKDIPYHLIEHGDLVFRKGRSLESYAVYMTSTNENYSHVGLIIKENNSFFVIHAAPSEEKNTTATIFKDNINTFLSGDNASAFAFYRPILDQEKIGIAINKALYYYNNSYTFDKKFDLTTDDELYCTELIVKSFATACSEWNKIPPSNVNLLFMTKSIILPKDIINKEIIKLIYNY